MLMSGAVFGRIGRAHAAAGQARSGEGGEHPLAEQPNGPQDLCLLHPRPLQPEDDQRDAEALAIPSDLLPHSHGVAEEKLIPRQLLEGQRKTFAALEPLVLLPPLIGPILRLQEGAPLADVRGSAFTILRTTSSRSRCGAKSRTARFVRIASATVIGSSCNRDNNCLHRLKSTWRP